MRSVISRVPGPSSQRQVVSPAEVLFKRGVRVAGGPAAGATTTQVAELSERSSPARPSGQVLRDPRIPVSIALSVLRSRVRSVASSSNNECASEAYVASQSRPASRVSVASRACVASEYPLRISRQSGQASPLSVLPLVLKALSRRAVAAKVSRGRRRLDPVTRNPSGRCDVAFGAYRSREVASPAVASASSWVASALGSRASALGSSASVSRSVASCSVSSRIPERIAPQSAFPECPEYPQRVGPRIVH